MKHLGIAFATIVWLIFSSYACGDKENQSDVAVRVKTDEKSDAVASIQVTGKEALQIKLTVNIQEIEAAMTKAIEAAVDDEDISRLVAKSLEELKIDKDVASAVGDLKSISIVLKTMKDDLSKMPRVDSLEDLMNLDIFRTRISGKLPLKDPWGNPYYYKTDDDNPKKFWLGSAGIDGNFERFGQKKKNAPESDDIVLTDDAISLGPKIL
jgi:hypothetical protein